MGSALRPDVLVTTETREYDEPAVRVLVLSWLKFYPGEPTLYVIAPNASDALRAFCARHPRVTLDTQPLEGGFSYNVKPQTFERLYEAGFRKPLWFDSDTVIGPGFEERIYPKLDTAVVVAEEPTLSTHPPAQALTANFGWAVGKVLPRIVNGGFTTIAIDQRAIVTDWRDILLSEEYRAAQQAHWSQRPAHLFGDQEVLTALLGAKRHEGAELAWLHEGHDIIQMFGPAGYSPAQRLRQWNKGLPAMVHSMGHKPWRAEKGEGSALRRYYDRMHGELSPYIDVARHVVAGEADDYPWLTPRSAVAGAMRWATANNFALAGLPLAAFDGAVRRLKRMMKLDQIQS